MTKIGEKAIQDFESRPKYDQKWLDMYGRYIGDLSDKVCVWRARRVRPCSCCIGEEALWGGVVDGRDDSGDCECVL